MTYWLKWDLGEFSDHLFIYFDNGWYVNFCWWLKGIKQQDIATEIIRSGSLLKALHTRNRNNVELFSHRQIEEKARAAVNAFALKYNKKFAEIKK